MARGLASLITSENQHTMTLAFRKKERGERVFIDWLRNAPYSTSVSPWSLRARPGAPVAAPIHWDEIEEVAPEGVRLSAIEDRLGIDPWDEFGTVELAGVREQVDAQLDAAGIVLESFDRFRS